MVSKQIDDVTSVAFFTGNIPHNLLQWNRHSELLYFCFENRIMQNINPLRPKRGSQWEYCEKYLSENITFNPCCHAVERWICFGNFKLFIQTQITFSFGCVERCEFSYCYPGDFWSETVAFYCPVFFSYFCVFFIIFKVEWFCVVVKPVLRHLLWWLLCEFRVDSSAESMWSVLRKWCLGLSILHLEGSCSCFCSCSFRHCQRYCF